MNRVVSWTAFRPVHQKLLGKPLGNANVTCKFSTATSKPSSLVYVGSSPMRSRNSQLLVRRLHSNPMVVSSRSFSMGAFPKLIMRVGGMGAAAGSATIGGLAYMEYKVKEVRDYTSEKLEQASGIVGGAYDSVSGAFSGALGVLRSFGGDGEAGDAEGPNSEGRSEESSKSDNSQQSGGNGGPEDVAAAALTAAAVAVANTDEDDEVEMMKLTRQMIEIRQILQKVDQGDTLQLPSIVVIGSQSSGKSSVLEAIVGHEFLPKGSNMVTRRPIELTLINTPESAAEYGEFPALGMGKITDFTQIQKTLTDLNLAVPEREVVSDEPIQLYIYSPSVPDLTLIDLPGYIQVSAFDQPESLKDKISLLCEKYIQPPNVILAISSADVDLANSTALRASRRVDPRGERTIGVVTKMDLVDINKGVAMLAHNQYPLRMGYVGVITKSPSLSGGLFRGPRTSSLTDLVSANESSYFGSHPEFDECTVGTKQLRKKLMTVLESTMAASLQPTFESIQSELEEASYQFKVEYNDRMLTPETYLAQSVDTFKLAFKDLTQRVGRDQVKQILKSELDQNVLDLLAQRYWNKPFADDGTLPASKEPPLSTLMDTIKNKNPDDLIFWHRKLDASTSALTKLGVGRMSTSLVTSALTSEIDKLVASTNFKNHPFAQSIINDAASSILSMRFYSTADQVENCIKPFKYEVEVDDREWTTSREHAYNLLKEELSQCDAAFNGLKKSIGSSKLSQVMKFIDQSRTAKENGMWSPPEGTEAFGFSQALLKRGREALFLQTRSDILKMRMAAIKSRQCQTKDNKYQCPEIFLDVVADKLTQTAVLFLNVELLSDFYYNFPRELDARLGSALTKEQVEVFAKEDPKIKNHIELQQRKELLSLAMEKMEAVIELDKTRRRNKINAML